MTQYAVRFSKKQRLEHFVVMTTFVLLALTGFPQKFHEAGFSRFLVKLFGGLDGARLVPSRVLRPYVGAIKDA